jgi:hypothetical protein
MRKRVFDAIPDPWGPAGATDGSHGCASKEEMDMAASEARLSGTRAVVGSRSRWVVRLCLLVALVAVVLAAMTTAAYADVRTDKYLYAFSELVQITGEGMQPAEAVAVEVFYPDGALAQSHLVSADEVGAFSDLYYMSELAPAGVYAVTATGQTSGTSFTCSFDPVKNFSFTVRAGETLSATVKYNESVIRYELVSGPTHELSFSLGGDGAFSYEAGTGYLGTDTFEYAGYKKDTVTPHVTGVVTITVTGHGITVTAVAGQTKVYGETDPALTYSFTLALETGDSFTGALSRAAGEDVGSYAIGQGTLALPPGYAVTFVPADFTITHRGVTVAADATSKTYGQVDPPLTFSLKSGTLAFSETLGSISSGDLSRAAGEDVGDYAIGQGTVTFSSNYSVTFEDAKLSIDARPITVAADAQAKVYGDGDPALTYKITAGGLQFTDAFGGALARDGGEDVGVYAIKQGTLALSSNYDLSYVGDNLTISHRDITVTADPQAKVYGDGDPALTYKITDSGLQFEDNFTGLLTRAAGENVGDYAIGQGTLALTTNYHLTFVGANFTITPKPITVTVDGGQTKVYGDSDPTAFTYGFSPDLVGTDAFSGALERASGENVGTYAIGQGALSLGGNYAIAFTPADFEITPKHITGTFTAHDKTYDSTTDAAVDSRGLVGALSGDDVWLSGGTAAFANEHVGTWKVTLTGASLSGTDAGNYILDSVTKESASITALHITGTFAAKDKIYDGDDAAAVDSRGLVGAIEGDDVSLDRGTAAFANEHAGTWDVTLSGAGLIGDDAGNYTLESVADDSAEITQRDLTVTATGLNKVFDDNSKAKVVLSSNAVDADDLGLHYASASFADKNVGTGKPISVLGITIDGDDAGNYNLLNDTASATANIIVAPTSMVLTVKSVQYTDVSTFKATITPASIGDSALQGTVTFRVGGTTVGSVTLNGTNEASVNYQAMLKPGSWPVTAVFTSDDLNFRGCTQPNALGTPLGVTKEDASVTSLNAPSVSVTPNAPSGSVTVNGKVDEAQDGSTGGDLTKIAVIVTLTGASGGGNNYTLGPVYAGSDGSFTLSRTGVALDAYEVNVSLGSDYFLGPDYYDALAVYDPSLGFATGGGWFRWNSPGLEKTSFGFVTKYGKNGTNAKGSLLIIRHMADGSIYRLKSNSLSALSLGTGTNYGWVSLIGKSTFSYVRPDGTSQGGGNYTFTMYAEDRNQPGTGSDVFSIKATAPTGSFSAAGLTSPTRFTISGGNIVAPHTAK